MTEDIPSSEKLADLLVACLEYPTHELVAYSQGMVWDEVEHLLRLGLTTHQDGELGEWAREYYRRDADLAKETFALLRKGGTQQFWAYFLARWPFGSTALQHVLSSPETEQMSLEQGFVAPNPEVTRALERTGWFRISDLGSPTEALAKALADAGYVREVGGAAASPDPSTVD